MTSAVPTSVYARIAGDLANQVRSGEWADRSPPSVRQVAGLFGVSVVTASRALQVLRERGVRFPKAEAGDAPAAERWAVCLHVSANPYRHAALRVTAAGFEALAGRGAGVFDFDAVKLSEGLSQEDLRKRLRAGGYRGLFLLPGRANDAEMREDEALLSACGAEGLPVVLVERNLRGDDRPLAADLACFHDLEGGRLLTRHLLALGRKRIAFVTGSPSSSHTERAAGYLSAIVSAGLTPLLAWQPSGVSPREAYGAIVDRLAEEKADAVICFHDYAAVGVMMEALRRGVRVPGDLAVAGFYDMDIGESFSIGVTTYGFPAEEVASRALDLMRWRLADPLKPPIKLVVPGRLIVRDSTDPSSLRPSPSQDG